MRCLSLLILVSVLAAVGCAQSRHYEHLHVASGTRTFWHDQPGDLKVGLGFRERDGQLTEAILFVRNDGLLPATIPELTPSTASLYINGKRIETKAPADAKPADPIVLEPGASRSFIYPYDFKKGKAYRAFGAVGPLKDGNPRSRIVTPEVAVSAIFGPPLRYHFTRWSTR